MINWKLKWITLESYLGGSSVEKSSMVGSCVSEFPIICHPRVLVEFEKYELQTTPWIGFSDTELYTICCTVKGSNKSKVVKVMLLLT